MTNEPILNAKFIFEDDGNIMLMNCIYCDNKVIAYCDFAIALEPKHTLYNKRTHPLTIQLTQ